MRPFVIRGQVGHARGNCPSTFCRPLVGRAQVRAFVPLSGLELREQVILRYGIRVWHVFIATLFGPLAVRPVLEGFKVTIGPGS